MIDKLTSADFSNSHLTRDKGKMYQGAVFKPQNDSRRIHIISKVRIFQEENSWNIVFHELIFIHPRIIYIILVKT